MPVQTTEDGRNFVTDARSRAWFVQDTFEGTIKGGRVVMYLAQTSPGEQWSDWGVVCEQYRDCDREPRQTLVLFETTAKSLKFSEREPAAREQFVAKVEQLKGVQ